MQINIPLARKLLSEENLSHPQNSYRFHSFTRSLIRFSLTSSFSPFIELFEMNHPLNGPHASQLTCDVGFISRDWKSFFFLKL